MNNLTFLSVIMFELAMGMYMYFWQDEVIDFVIIFFIYIKLTCVFISWISLFGSQNLLFIYHHPKDEEDMYRTIEFPNIFMKG